MRRFRQLGSRFLLATVLLAPAACGSTPASSFDAGADAGQDAPSLADAPSEIGTFVEASTVDVPDAAGMVAGVTAFCNDSIGGLLADLQACCSSADQQTSLYGLYAGALAQAQQNCASAFSASIVAGRARFDASAVQACQHAIQAKYGPKLCWPELTANHGNDTPYSESACDGVIVGQQAVGQPCSNDYECQSGLSCVGETTSQDGRCQAPGMSGDTCGLGNCAGNCVIEWGLGNHPACAQGLYCLGTCQALSNDGQACFGDGSCVAPDVCTDNKCAPTLGGAGAPCQQWSDCQEAFYCIRPSDGGAGGVCTARGAAGAACTEADGCLGYCQMPDAGTAGTCVAICGSM